jgi:hypothetical protein
MAYTTIDLPTEYFNTVLYAGNGATQTHAQLDFNQIFFGLKIDRWQIIMFLEISVRGAN